MVDCAENLHTGAEMLLQLHVYLLSEAFKQHRLSESSDDPRSIFGEGHETIDEQNLRERKDSLLQLFKAVDLNPRRPNAFLCDSNPNIDVLENVKQNDSASAKKTKKVGVNAVEAGKDDEDDEAELLSEGQLDMIYEKSVSILMLCDSR